jgi:hypothetical protein
MWGYVKHTVDAEKSALFVTCERLYTAAMTAAANPVRRTLDKVEDSIEWCSHPELLKMLEDLGSFSAY